MNQKPVQPKSKASKIDFNQILPAETLDRTRITEKMVISAVLNHQHPDSDQLKFCLDAGLGPEDFSSPGLALIYETMISAYLDSSHEDFLLEVLKDAHYQNHQNQNYLNQIFDEGSSIRNETLKHHVKVLKMLSFERQEIFLIAQIISCLQHGDSYDCVYLELEKLRKEKSEYGKDEKNQFGQGLSLWWKDFESKKINGYSNGKEIKSHLPSLEEKTQGFRRAEVSVLAGSPGSGKSALALNLILAAVNGSKAKTTLISLEMTLDEIMARVVVQMTDRVPLKFILDPTRLQSNKWQGNENELNRLNKEIQKAKDWTNKLLEEGVFDATALNSFHPDVVEKSVEKAARQGSDFIVLDHIHRILFPSKEGIYTEQMTNFMVTLTEISKSYGCNILVLSQLNRESSKESRKPRLTDLRGSGGIEENASLAMFLSRELDSTEADLSILKARSGRSGWNIPMVFNSERLTFAEDIY